VIGEIMGKLKGKGVMVALDTSLERAVQVVDALKNAKGHFSLKVGRPLEMKHTIHVISLLKQKSDLPVVYDGKIADIPHISSIIAQLAFDAGADGVIVHGFCGSDTLSALKELGLGDVIVVADMSHPGSQDFYAKHFHEIVDRAVQLDVDGIVVPATKPERIQFVRDRFSGYILSPGVGVQGAKPGVPSNYGADWEIVGRAVYDAEDPKRAAEEHYRCVLGER